jgi:Ca-activated chloride channel homolog
MRAPRLQRLFPCFFVATSLVALSLLPSAAQDPSSKRPVELDKGVVWQRDPSAGELGIARAGDGAHPGSENTPAAPDTIEVRTEVVPVTCVVSTSDGTPVPGLQREDFRVFEGGIAQKISYFDASTEPASVALILDASPSVLPQADAMREAADALIDALAPLDQAAVVDFSAHTYVQLPFSDVREEIRRAVDRVNARDLFADTGGSNIYEAVYLVARKLYAGRTGRKAIVLLTDGQDSGLGLTYDPASMSPEPGRAANRLTFDDVARLLAAEDIQLFAVSTENRPKVMTLRWLEAHQNETLVTEAARSLGIPAYTLYLAELVRRAGGQLYFLNESLSVADTFRKIAGKIRGEYTLGFYPESGAEADNRPGWHPLRVELPGEPGTRIAYRAAYYVPAAP